MTREQVVAFTDSCVEGDTIPEGEQFDALVSEVMEAIDPKLSEDQRENDWHQIMGWVNDRLSDLLDAQDKRRG